MRTQRMVRGLLAAAVGAAGLVLPGAETVEAQRVELRAEVGASARAFLDAPLFQRQSGATLSPSLTFTPGVEIELGDQWNLIGEVFARWDAHDDRRTHMDVRELGVEYFGSSVIGFVGIGKVFWGVTEVRHLVDIVNQDDFVEDLDGEDKLGQPMVSASVDGGWGVLDLFYLPYSRERTFPAADARMRGPLPVGDHARYESSREQWYPSFAARGLHTFGRLDVGLSAFHGTSREPRFIVESEGPAEVVPFYDIIDQVGVDLQWTGDATLWKLEGMTRGGHEDRIFALTAGLEHTVYQVLGSDGDLGLLGELLLDDRDPTAPPTIFDNDLFMGGRWAMNDVADTSLLGGPVVDFETGEVVGLIEAQRRLGDSWVVELEGRLFGNTDPASFLNGVRRDGYLAFGLTRYW